MNKFVKSSILSALVTLGAVAATAQSAQAGGSFGLYFDSHGHGGVHVGIGHGGGHWGGHGGKWGKGKWGKGCSQHAALQKAASIGVKKRWVQHVGHNNIVVRGTKFGSKVRVVIGRGTPYCPVKTVQYV